ncbi:hypothetical protein MMC26_002570 [Xylographa opegraphella]|nr:hypothetical protein [Xylographa opegraphella]
MDPARYEEPDDHGHNSRKTPSDLDSFLATIPDKFDVSGDDLVAADTQNTTDQNSKILQAFDSEYGIDHATHGRVVAESSSMNHQGLLSHDTENQITQSVLTQSDPTSPTVVSQLSTADEPQHQSAPLNQRNPNNLEQDATFNSRVPAAMTRSLSTSGFWPETSKQPNTQSIHHEPTNTLNTLPLKRHFNRPLTSSPLAREMTIIAEGVQAPTTSNYSRSSTTAIARGNRVSENPSASEDRRYKFAASSPFLGFTFDGTEQAVNSVRKYEPENASYMHGTLPDTHFGQANIFPEHSFEPSPYGSAGPFGVHTQLSHPLPYGGHTLFDQPSKNWPPGLAVTNDEAQSEHTNNSHPLVHNPQSLFMGSEERTPYSATPLTYPQYYGEPNHYDPSGNFHFEPAQTSQQLVLKSERAIEHASNSLNYGQPDHRNHYVGTMPTPGLAFGNTFMQANDVPYYLPGVSRGSRAPVLKFSRLYEFENQKDIANDDHAWISDATYPHSPGQEQLYVKKIIMAMSDMDSANDNPGMLEMWSKLKKNAELLETTAWKLLALRDEKTICKHLLSPDYAESFVDDPVNAANRVNNNRKVNGGKKMAIEKGRAAMSLVKETRTSEDIDPEVSTMKNEYEQPGEGYSRQASQQLVNNDLTEGTIGSYTSTVIHGDSEDKREASAAPVTPVPPESSTKKSAKKGLGTKRSTLKTPSRKSTRKAKTGSKDEDVDSDDEDEDASYEPIKTPKRKRGNRSTKYPTTQLADGSYVIKTVSSPPTTPVPRRKQQTTLEAPAPNQSMAAFGRTSSNLDQADSSARDTTFNAPQDTAEIRRSDMPDDQPAGTEPYPFMFGYQNQNSAHQLQSHNDSLNAFTAASDAYQQASRTDFVNPLSRHDSWTSPYSGGATGTTSQSEAAGPLQAEPGHGIQDEGENYHLSLGRRRFRRFKEPRMDDGSDVEETQKK